VFGWAILHQTVTLVQLGGVAVVVVAGIGAQRVADHREPLAELV
jgi:threonine/homoserine efflux transporter RhtA